MIRTTPHVLALILLTLSPVAVADDAFYEISRAQLNVTDGQLPFGGAPLNRWSWRAPLPAHAVLDGEGEIYCVTPDMNAPQRWLGNDGPDHVLFVRAAADKDVRGRLFIPNQKRDGMDALSFVIPREAARPASQRRFQEAKLIYYEYLLNQNVPGRPWWRQRAQEAAVALGDGARQFREQLPRRPQFGLDETFALFTGTRAIDENLQLDRALRLRPSAGEKAIEVNTITGITVKEFDWQPLVKDKKPETDPLARLIPSDQHALFVPSFDAVARLIDEGTRLGVETLGFDEPTGEDAMTLARYQKQLCLPLNALTRFAGPRLVEGIALTGSDPYFRAGTDVAVLFQSSDAKALHDLLTAQVAAAREANPAAKPVAGQVGGVAYAGSVSRDRSICAYVARVGDAVVVTNSPKQLERLVMTHQGAVTALASLPEYTFFRDRYRRAETDETALLMLSDATIRRWCGPRWRIADSRRTRAAAVLAALQVANHDAVIKGNGESRPLSQDLMEGEDVRLESHGATSSTFGHLGFMTPIVELDLDHVTESERDAYERWRDTYQQNWRQFFDPIAVRVTLTKEKIAADITVMPLIENTDYRQIIDLTRGVTLRPDAGDPHDESIIHLVFAINEKSRIIDDWSSEQQRKLKDQVLPWIGDTVAIYMDAAKKDAPHDFPVALRIDSRDHAKLLEFLPAARDVFAFALGRERKFETRNHNGVAYTSAVVNEEERPRFFYNAVHYVALPDALTISWSEDVIRRAIDRHAARAKQPQPAQDARDQSPRSPAWLGSHVAVHVEPEFLKLLAGYGIGDYAGGAQRVSWANLPILNELKRRYPDGDPLDVHEKLFATRPVCPAGGRYVWNEPYQTMESTVVGHPAQPKPTPSRTSPTLDLFRSAAFGLDFEHSGLRARASLMRAQPR